MTIAESEIESALQPFFQAQAPVAFQLLEGSGVLVTAPHSVTQVRLGKEKWAEPHTGALALLLHRQCGCAALYKLRNDNDDANYDARSPFRDAMVHFVCQRPVRFVLDLHQLSPRREEMLNLGTGRGANIHGRWDMVEHMQDVFVRHGLPAAHIDAPYDATWPHSVCVTAAETCGIPAFMLEMNTRLLMPEYREYSFGTVFAALSEIIQILDKESTL